MKYMLDTNICIYIIKKKPYEVFNKFINAGINNICVSSITIAELEYGIHKSVKQEQNKLAFYKFITPLQILEFNSKAACEYGELRAKLERNGNIIGSLDMLIAGHALSENLSLVTNNTKEFRRVENLKLENWISNSE